MIYVKYTPMRLDQKKKIKDNSIVPEILYPSKRYSRKSGIKWGWG